MPAGRRSSGVMVTGGDDARVNMWAVGRQRNILVRIRASDDKMPRKCYSPQNSTDELLRRSYLLCRASAGTPSQLNASPSTRRRKSSLLAVPAAPSSYGISKRPKWCVHLPGTTRTV
jgi:hypothetical protein